MDPGSPDVSARATESPRWGKEGPEGEGQQPRSDRWHWVLGALLWGGCGPLLCTPRHCVPANRAPNPLCWPGLREASEEAQTGREWDQLTPSSGMTATGGLLGSMDFASLRKGGWKRLECVCVCVSVCARVCVQARMRVVEGGQILSLETLFLSLSMTYPSCTEPRHSDPRTHTVKVRNANLIL